ncbi:hypothetical protein ACLF6K_27595 [Streptomyces xanthophaeus]|uniref:hypothetical protein n=1 Tax=Streptomyces xanthophaeus TaxID=67385 RepID=UPI00399003C8
MTRTTPPRPLDVEALFPGLSVHRRTTTRLHPRAGSPGVADSHVGGPLLWPADEPWPVCEGPHGPAPDAPALRPPQPLLAVAQLYGRDVPDLPAGPEGHDLLQVFWCPFDAHGPTGYGMYVHLRWRRAAGVREVLARHPDPGPVGFEGYLPQPCVLHPEQVAEYPYIEVLPGELGERVEAWEDAQEEASYEAQEEAEEEDSERAGEGASEETGALPSYQSDLSLAPGWKAGGHAAWNVTGPGTMDCRTCGSAMELLLTIATREFHSDSTSWIPLEDSPLEDRLPEDRLPEDHVASPTGVVVGNHGKLNVFACPQDPAHPHDFSVQ